MIDLRGNMEAIARRAGEIASRYQREPDKLGTEMKGPMDFVTAADKAVEQAIVGMLREHDPHVAVLGEEGGSSGAGENRLWIIDPIDGTANYMRNLPWWSVSIAMLENGRPHAGVIHAPAMGITVSAVSGQGVTINGRALSGPVRSLQAVPLILSGASPENVSNGRAESVSRIISEDLAGMERRLGCGTASLLQVLLGKADLYIGLGERIWDVSAAAIVADELGMRHTVEWRRASQTTPFDFVCGERLLVEKAARSLFHGCPA